jgi:peptidoglycan/xylan/chitin deacetylase (PgdA/CDA1 family)
MSTTISRRGFIKCLAGCAALNALPGFSVAWAAQGAASGVPIAMFHKVDEAPQYPEDISSQSLADLFDYAWSQGFHPVNMSDILLGRVDAVVPKGFKPLGVTADDSHRSVVYTRKEKQDADQRNDRSFYEILCTTCKNHGIEPRATFFISEESNNRYKGGKGYFGDTPALPSVVKMLSATPAVELGFHTRWHKSMKKMGYAETSAVLRDQLMQFEHMGIIEYFSKIIAYPFGQPPKKSGIRALKDLGFYGGVLALGGKGEAGENPPPFCLYDSKPLGDPFFIPRVNIGAKLFDRGLHMQSFDPLDDFDKDIGKRSDIYVSKG